MQSQKLPPSAPSMPAVSPKDLPPRRPLAKKTNIQRHLLQQQQAKKIVTTKFQHRQELKQQQQQQQPAPPLASIPVPAPGHGHGPVRAPPLPNTPSSTFSSSSLSSSQRRKIQQQQHNNQFHRRTSSQKTSIPSLPKPSHKPPSTSNDFDGDLISQDVFAEAFKKRNDRLRVLFPGMDRFEMERMDMVRVINKLDMSA